MNQTLQTVYMLIVWIGLLASFYNWIRIRRGKNRYLACAIWAFVMGVGAALLHQWPIAIIAALLILVIGLSNSLPTK